MLHIVLNIKHTHTYVLSKIDTLATTCNILVHLIDATFTESFVNSYN